VVVVRGEGDVRREEEEEEGEEEEFIELDMGFEHNFYRFIWYLRPNS